MSAPPDPAPPDRPRSVSPSLPPPRPWSAAWLTRCALLAIPLMGIAELGAHFVQVRAVVRDDQWIAAREAVRARLRPEDLLVFSPAWSEPLGRRFFGEDLATLDRMAYPDVSRFPRAVEVSMRGERAADLAGWSPSEEARVGPFLVRVLANPSYAPLADDLVAHLRDGRVEVHRQDGEHGERDEPCPLVHSTSQSGNIGFGPTTPADRYACPRGGFVGESVIADLGYKARRCVYAPPVGGPAALRVVFKQVKLAARVHGHHGISVHAERDRDGAPVTLAFEAGGRVLATLVHNDGDGWKGFEFPTDDLAGTTADLTVSVTADGPSKRQYCFEADTR